MHKLTNLFIAAAMLSIIVMPAQAKNSKSISRLVVFGDSNVDMGLADPEGDSAAYLTFGTVILPPNVDGRSSNGPIVVEYASEELDVPISNYSVGGATTGTLNLIKLLAPDYFPDAEVTGASNQVAYFESDLGGSKADKQAVYVYWAGSNDLYGATSDTAPGASDSAIANIEVSITKLVDLGARKILVATRTPRQDFYGDDNVNSMVFNSALRVKVQELHATLKANIEIFEAFDYVAEMKYNPESYGFTNTKDLCIDDPICSVDPVVARGYMLWDAPHKTTRVHEILGARLSDQARQMSHK